MEKIKNNKYLVLALLFTLLSMAVTFWLFGFKVYDDSNGFIDIINWFQGQEVAKEIDLADPGFIWMIMRPMGPLIALPFEFLGEGAGIIVQNILFYFFAAFLVFRIIQLIFHNKEQAFLGAILFAASLPMIKFGISYMTDMGAWFFYVLSVFLTLLYFKNRDEKLIIINGFLSGTGALMKENGGLGILFFLMMILLSKEFNLKEKFLKALKLGIPFLLPYIGYQICFFGVFHTTSFNEYSGGIRYFFTQGLEELKIYPGSVYSHMNRFTIIIYAYAGEFLKAFGILGLFFALIGLWREFLQKFKERGKIYLALLPNSVAFLFFQVADSRFAFLSTLPLILLASRGLIYLKNGRAGKWAVLFLAAAYVVLNYYTQIVGSYRLIFLQLISLIK